ncbi:flagellar biosynthesis protein FlhA [Cedecea sp. NFIX57]|nr:flagellar biosynthesis protein FlhA [Cedecea sp. NFIX57]
MAIVWIDPDQKARALNLGYQVVDCASVVATHVNKVARQHLPDLFNYDDITHLHSRLALQAPKLAEDLANALNFSQLLKVYRQLLLEQVSLKDIVTIAATLLESSAVTKDPQLLCADVRYALRRAILHNINGDRRQLAAYTIDNDLENLLLNALNQAQQAGKVALDSFPVDPNILAQLQNTMPMIYEQMKAKSLPPLLLVTPQLRPILARYGRLFSAALHVLSYNEVPDDSDLKIVGTLA